MWLLLLLAVQVVEALAWGRDAAVARRMDEWRARGVWPHVFEQERGGGQFVQHLECLPLSHAQYFNKV